MIDDLAVGIQSTSTDTRIDAFLIGACFVPGAVRTNDALGTTCWW